MANPFVAEVRMFGGNFAPTGWAFCNGQLLPINQNQALFSLLGTTFGGDGKVTFALPDLRGRVAIGSGQGPGLSLYDLGQRGGAETVILTIGQLPAHTHVATAGTLTMRAKNAVGNSQSPLNSVPAIEAAGVTATYSTANADANMGATAIAGAPALAEAGLNQPVGILPPYLTMSYIIALQGIFPSRN
jgi:microcystin-dependent protein